jgi:hypothetical protein
MLPELLVRNVYLGMHGRVNMFGCLSMLLIPIACGTASVFLLGSFLHGFLPSLISVAALNMGLLKLSNWQNRAMIQRWAKERRFVITDLHLQDGFITPSPMPWWMDWSAYEMLATNENGQSLRFYFFITGFLYCLFGVELNVSTPDDYITIRLSDDEVRGLSVEETVQLVEKKTEEKRASQQEGERSDDQPPAT